MTKFLWAPLSMTYVIACAGSTPPPAPPADTAAKALPKAPMKAPIGPPPKANRLAAAHILIAHKGGQRARPTVTRTKAEALALAESLARDLGKLERESAAGAKAFAAAARKHSDCPSAARGGDLGSWRRGRMVPAFDRATLQLHYGQVSKAIETPFGYHVIRRNKLPIQYAASHILIAYEGAKRAVIKQRTKAQALAMAQALAKKLQEDPSQFARAAQSDSDGPMGPGGGKMGVLPKGILPPAVEAALYRLKIGQVSDPVQSPFGFHIVLREKP